MLIKFETEPKNAWDAARRIGDRRDDARRLYIGVLLRSVAQHIISVQPEPVRVTATVMADGQPCDHIVDTDCTAHYIPVPDQMDIMYAQGGKSPILSVRATFGAESDNLLVKWKYYDWAPYFFEVTQQPHIPKNRIGMLRKDEKRFLVWIAHGIRHHLNPRRKLPEPEV